MYLHLSIHLYPFIHLYLMLYPGRSGNTVWMGCQSNTRQTFTYSFAHLSSPPTGMFLVGGTSVDNVENNTDTEKNMIVTVAVAQAQD